MIRPETAKISLPGNRSINQDRCSILSAPNCTLMVLADGLGGHPKGEVAAQTLINMVQQIFNRSLKPIPAPERFMQACIQRAHQAILEFGNRHNPPIAPKTTAVMALVQNGMCYWAHVGDSRFYLIRKGAIAAQTRDHSLVQLMHTIHSGNPERTQGVSRNSITRCLGGEISAPMPTYGAPTQLLPGDTLLICSDGLWGQLEEKELLAGISNLKLSLNSRITALGEFAQNKGAPNSDNVTACALQWPLSARADIVNGGGDEALDAAIEHLNALIIHKPKS